MRLLKAVTAAAITCLVFLQVAAVAARAASVPVDFLGYRSYAMFTRLVFDTGGTPPEKFKIGYDEAGGKVVFAPVNGTMAFSFKPFKGINPSVKAIDYIEVATGKLGVVVRLGKSVLGLRVSYLYRPNRLVLDIYSKAASKPFMPVKRGVSTVAIDPGHGGTMLGVVGMDALAESDAAYRLAVKLQTLLNMSGYRVVLTRGADDGPGPDERAGLANSEHADMFISLHAGYFRGPVARLYAAGAGELDGAEGAPMQWRDQHAMYLPESLGLAKKLAGHLSALGGGEPETRNARLSGFEGLAMPAVMVEFGGMSTDGRQSTLSDDAYLDRLASLLANAVKSYSGGM